MAIVTEDRVDKELKALFGTGGYRSEQAAVGHALEVLLAANPVLRLYEFLETANSVRNLHENLRLTPRGWRIG